jgi:beta-lactamase class A
MDLRFFSRFAAASIAICVFAFPSVSAQAQVLPGSLSSLQASLSQLATHAPGHVGIMIQELSTGLSSSVNGSANMPAASVIKIPVMVEVFRQMELGKLGLNSTVHLTTTDRDWGWGDLADAPAGKKYTVDRLLRLMITESDNTATNMLIRKVGRQSVNTTMHKLGLHNTELTDYIRSDGDIRSIRTSPADMTKLLTKIAHEKLIDAWSSREMLAILAGQQHNGLLPQPLPAGLEIAHKTGTLHDTLNDVGIVFLNNDPYVIAVMTTQLPNLDAGRDFIHRVSHRTYLAFEQRIAERAGGFSQIAESAADPVVEKTAREHAVTTNNPDGPSEPEDLRMWSPQPSSPKAPTAAKPATSDELDADS